MRDRSADNDEAASSGVSVSQEETDNARSERLVDSLNDRWALSESSFSDEKGSDASSEESAQPQQQTEEVSSVSSTTSDEEKDKTMANLTPSLIESLSPAVTDMNIESIDDTGALAANNSVFARSLAAPIDLAMGTTVRINMGADGELSAIVKKDGQNFIVSKDGSLTMEGVCAGNYCANWSYRTFRPGDEGYDVFANFMMAELREDMATGPADSLKQTQTQLMISYLSGWKEPAAANPPSASPALFGTNSFWNMPLSANASIASNSTGLVQELIANSKLAPVWFNTIGYSTPLYIADETTAHYPVSIIQNGQVLTWTTLNDEAQKGVPIPLGAQAAPGDDGHITIWDQANDRLYEFWQFRFENNGWVASWGGIIDSVSTSNGIMPTVTNKAGGSEKWGATATGLPMIGGTVLLEELASGVIEHALAIAIQRPAASTYVWPAQRTDGFYTGPNAISEGQRFRFLDSITIDPNWSPLIQMIVEAVRDYGLVVRDKGVGISFYGEDPAVYGLSESAYYPYMNGLPLWEVMPQFPWDKLVAIV